MASDEQYLISKYGKRQPFRVPEGYFDALTREVESRVASERGDKSAVETVRRVSLRWRIVEYVAAACAAVAVVAVGAVSLLDNEGESVPGSMASHVARHDVQSSDVTDATYDNAIADYSMLDNDQIYSLVASN